MQYTLPHYTVRALINYLSNNDVDRKQLLAEISTTEVELNNSDQRYNNECYEKLLLLGQQLLGIPNVGFAHGRDFELGFWGLLGHIVAASPSLADAIAYQKRYQCLLGNTGQAYHEVEGDVVTIRWLTIPQASANSIEQVITAWVAFAFSYTQSNDKPIAVYFVHSPLADESAYQAFFGCPVYFGASFNGVKLQTSSLSIPLSSFNEEVLNVLCAHAENKLLAKRKSASLDIIEQYIITTLPDKVPELTDVAQHLGISCRQLQRRLQKEETHLSSLIEQIRKSLAVSYLTQTDHKLLYISTMLGYSEQSAFQRAFKRWSGQTPQAFRLKPFPIQYN